MLFSLWKIDNSLPGMGIAADSIIYSCQISIDCVVIVIATKTVDLYMKVITAVYLQSSKMHKVFSAIIQNCRKCRNKDGNQLMFCMIKAKFPYSV